MTWSPNNNRRSDNSTQPATNVTRVSNVDSREVVDKYGNMGAPFFRIEINDLSNNMLFSSESSVNQSGYDLEGLMIYEVEFDETDCQTSMIRLTMANPNLDLQDGIIFTEGNTVDLWMGYDGLDPDYMGRGFIVELSPRFDVASIPTFTVCCYDISHFMMEEGRGEIIAEGTNWQTRRRRTVSTGAQQTIQNRGLEDDARGDSRPNPGDTAGRRREAERDAEGRGNLSDNPDADVIREAVHTRHNQNARANDSATQAVSRAEWTPWRQPRRGRRNGKVWRGKTDSQIVEAIFGAYGIVPYTTASAESRISTRTISINPSMALVGTEINDNPPEENATTSTSQEDREARMLQARQAYIARQMERIRTTRGVHHISISTNPELDVSQIEANVIPIPTDGSNVEVTVREDRRVTQKNGTSDWDFIKELAKKKGYIVYVYFDYDSGRWIGYWGPDNGTPQANKYTFRYAQGDQTTLANITPTISLREQKTEIDLQFIDPRNGREQILRVSMDNISPVYSQLRRNSSTDSIEPIGNGPEVTLNIFGRRTSVVADRNFTDPEDARDWLVSFWIRHARDFCRIEAKTIIGIPEIRCRQIHTIEGLGRLNGDYFISKLTHRMSAGKPYETTFSGYQVVDQIWNTNDVVTDSSDIGELPPVEEEERNRNSV